MMNRVQLLETERTRHQLRFVPDKKRALESSGGNDLN